MFYSLWMFTAIPFINLTKLLHVQPNPPITGTEKVILSFDLPQEGPPPHWSISREDSLIGSFNSFSEEISFSPPLHAGEDLRIFARFKISGKVHESMARIEVANAPPAFQGAEVETEGDTLIIHLRIHDPENDSIHVSLLSPESDRYKVRDQTIRGPVPDAETTNFFIEISDTVNTIRVTLPVIIGKE